MKPIQAANGFSFRVGFSGYSGHLRVEPLYTEERDNPIKSLPDFVLPPAFPTETPESIEEHIKEKYLLPRLDEDAFSPEKAGKQWDFDWFARAKIPLEPSMPRAIMVPVWELPFRRCKEGSTEGKWEPNSMQVDVSDIIIGGETRGSFPRASNGAANDIVRGSINNRPFRPGGLEDQSLERIFPDGASNGEWVREVLNGGPAQTIPPGFKQGLKLGDLMSHPCSWNVYKDQSAPDDTSVGNLSELSVQFDDLFKKAWEEDVAELDKDGMHHSNYLLFICADICKVVAIYYLEKGESVFVAAHTSAGKTVVAEYAFALASKHCTRAVYTAPIKTISNQKYRDFCGKFDVGLLTGDVSLRPEASCLIMTTEILRSMLYRGADIIRDIEWVIFDEVHYVNDVERGVVWEEVIIMLPRHINIILLSATVPNTIEFADWIGRTKQKKIRVTGTTKRPVPLEHCLFYSGELYKICEGETFIPLGLKAAKDAYKKKNSSATSGGTGSYSGSSTVQDGARGQKREPFNRGKQNKHSGPQNFGNYTGTGWGNQSNGGGQNSWGSRRTTWLMLIDKLSKKSLLPAVIFGFSKNQCDKSADSISGTDLTSSSEKSEIRVFCDKAFSRLKGSDRNLPQVVRVQSLLCRGIGVHHAGLLPIVKEVVEMLFCRGVIKETILEPILVLFSTETFAMGVNAPARTVVFDTLRKFDGKEFRPVLPGEYTQMAGRAGRRGLDKIGTVIVMCRDEIPGERDLEHVITGTPTKLESQFRLTYIMILHLLRVEELKVEDMLKRSFAEFHSQKKLPEQQQLLLRKLAQPKKTIECIKGEPAIEEYYEMRAEAEAHSEQISKAVMQTSAAQKFLTPGRVVVVKSQSVSSFNLVLCMFESSHS
ncbi:hypothetical protein GOBAR_DD33644 [Gossypium barbadense]|nr:hypothetical protein GOBAR_DD33644 [Gossypium barbadense]